MDDSILNVEGAVEFLGVSEKTLIKLLREEHIPARKIGREWRFSKAALIEWLATGDSIAYANSIPVFSFSKDRKGSFPELLASIREQTQRLQDGPNINGILDMDSAIAVPSDATMRVTYKQGHETEKLRFELFWPQREEFSGQLPQSTAKEPQL